MNSKKHPWVVTTDSRAGGHGPDWVPALIPGCIWIPLRNRDQHIVAYTLIEEQDQDLAKMTWHLKNDGYAARAVPRRHRRQETGGKKMERLHRVIMQAPPGVDVDHINRNRLDNRRSNLRFATPGEQARNASLSTRNTTGYKGVNFMQRAQRWSALVKFEGAAYYMGVFGSPEAAAFAYDFAARALHGRFAAINFKLSDRTIAALDEFRHYLLSKEKERGIATA